MKCSGGVAYWLGLTSLAKIGHYVWTHNGQEVNQTWWGCDQPHDSPSIRQPCVALIAYNGKYMYGWIDLPCSEQKWYIYAICEIDWILKSRSGDLPQKSLLCVSHTFHNYMTFSSSSDLWGRSPDLGFRKWVNDSHKHLCSLLVALWPYFHQQLPYALHCLCVVC